MPYYKSIPTKTFGDRLYRGMLKFFYRADAETQYQREMRQRSVGEAQPDRIQRLKEAIMEWYV